MKPLRPNKLTPGHNLKWESSRMMLPEHKEALIQHRKAMGKKEKPVLDEQRYEWFAEVIAEAINRPTDLVIKLFHPYEEKQLIGQVERVDIPLRQLKVIDSEGKHSWINLENITDIWVK